MLSPSLWYVLGASVSWPLLPLMYAQGKSIRKNIPALPEASHPEGLASGNSPELIRLLSIGESAIAGVGVDRHERGLTAALARTLARETGKSVQWEVWARSGYTAQRVARKIIPKIPQKQFDLVVIGLGGNDAFNLNAPWTWQRDIDRLVIELRKKYPNTPIVFANMPPIKDFPALTKLIQLVVGNLAELLGKQLQRAVSKHEHTYYHQEVIILDDWLQKIPGTTPQDFFSDGVHPSALTYETWGNELGQFILNRSFLGS